MNNIMVCMDPVGYGSKPQKYEIANISSRIANNVKHLNVENIKAFAEDVGQHGNSFTPATFKNGIRKVDSFEQMQLLALDFDNGVTFDEVSEKAKEYDLPILFAYETLTSTNQNKFRVAFLNNSPIEDRKLAELNQHALMEIFPEADKSCKDVSRMYFGGKKLMYFDETLPTVDTELLLRNLAIYLEDRSGPTHYKTHIRKFANKHNIRLKNGMFDVALVENPDESMSESHESRPEKVGVSDDGKNGKKSPKSFIIYRDHNNVYNNGNGEILPNPKMYFRINLNDGHQVASSSKQAGKSSNHKDYRATDLFNIVSSCRLYREFTTGERRLRYHELLGIAYNLIHVETGISVFKSILSSYPDFYDEEKRNKWDRNIKYLKNQYDNPQRCENFCPYKDTCRHTANILTTSKPKQGAMDRLSGFDETYCSVDEAHEDLRRKLIEAIGAEGTTKHIIKAQTALGKTHAYLNLAKESHLKFLIVVPTNILKRDVESRAKKMGIPVAVSPSLDEIHRDLETNVWDGIQQLRKSGLHSRVYPFISRLAYAGYPDLKKYLEKLDEFRKSDGHSITTHRRFLNMKENELKKYDAIIIDEDIIMSSIANDQGTIPISTLHEMLAMAEKEKSITDSNGVPKHQAYANLAKKIKGILKNLDNQGLFTMPAIEWETDPVNDLPLDELFSRSTMWLHDKSSYYETLIEEYEEVEGISALTDIPSFCLAEHFIYRKASKEKNLKEDCVTYLKPFKIKDIKFIMVSATANKKVCEYVFGGDNVEFYECKKARLKGKLNQYYDKSMSREYISKNPYVFDRIRKWSGFEHTITFKNYAKEAYSKLWFGNLAGIDYLKGQNINVVGTNHYPEFVYKLLPFALGLDFNHDAKMKYIPIKRNGYQFHFMTFEDEILQEFHLWMVESDLEQAVGRARLLRFDCVVNLFSNYPLDQAIMLESEY